MTNLFAPILFRIVIPTHNRADIIRDTLNSLIAQSYPNWTADVIDDGGNDETEYVVRDIGDKRIRYHWKKNEERSIARNRGVELSRDEDYVIFLDSDDRFLPEHLAKLATRLEKMNRPPAVHCGYRETNTLGDVLKTPQIEGGTIGSVLLRENLLAISAGAFRRDILDCVRFPDHHEAIFAEDWCFWLRIFCRYGIEIWDQGTVNIVCHEKRSVNAICPVAYERALNLVCGVWQNDEWLRVFLGEKAFGKLIAGRQLSIAQHYLIGRRKHRSRALLFLFTAMKTYPRVILGRIGLVSIKKILTFS